jgi:hypothetical protein
MDNQYETMMEAFSDLKSKGYHHTFTIIDRKLYCIENRRFIDPKTINIVEFHRFEGNSDPDDMSIIYVLEIKGGEKGIIVDAYGAYANTELHELLKYAHLKDS